VDYPEHHLLNGPTKPSLAERLYGASREFLDQSIANKLTSSILKAKLPHISFDVFTQQLLCGRPRALPFSFVGRKYFSPYSKYLNLELSSGF
jgi:hypothetical protein